MTPGSPVGPRAGPALLPAACPVLFASSMRSSPPPPSPLPSHRAPDGAPAVCCPARFATLSSAYERVKRARARVHAHSHVERFATRAKIRGPRCAALQRQPLRISRLEYRGKIVFVPLRKSHVDSLIIYRSRKLFQEVIERSSNSLQLCINQRYRYDARDTLYAYVKM